MLQNALKKRDKKGHSKKEAQGSIAEHFEELFGRLFGSKNAPGATSDRFLGEVRDSVNTPVITIHSKGSSGLELTKKRLRECFGMIKNAAKNGEAQNTSF